MHGEITLATTMVARTVFRFYYILRQIWFHSLLLTLCLFALFILSLSARLQLKRTARRCCFCVFCLRGWLSQLLGPVIVSFRFSLVSYSTFRSCHLFTNIPFIVEQYTRLTVLWKSLVYLYRFHFDWQYRSQIWM